MFLANLFPNVFPRMCFQFTFSEIFKFKDTLKSVAIRRDNQSITLQVNRNIIGALLSYSVKSGRATDLSNVNGDGSRRETNKSKVDGCY